MSHSCKTPTYFVAGGSLASNTPSYVKRSADNDLIKLVLASKFAYVLTASQMGKSSMMIRTAKYLEEKEGCQTARIDLTGIGTDQVTIEQWYRSLLGALCRDLDLSIDLETWWQEHSLSPVQRFINFLHDVVLQEINESRVIIFIDEIGCTTKLDASDDFFAAIRFIYNRRSINPIFNRLTFVLLGVASPSDLIKDSAHTFFNIGEEVILQDFKWAETTVLHQGLDQKYHDQGQIIFRRIYYWTEGHPYLTQKLCEEVVNPEKESWSNQQIDELVYELFLSDKTQRKRNLRFVRNRILNHPERDQLLVLYKKVYNGEKVAEDRKSHIQNQLKLSGIIKEKDGDLSVRNKIYQKVFDLKWIEKNIAKEAEATPEAPRHSELDEQRELASSLGQPIKSLFPQLRFSFFATLLLLIVLLAFVITSVLEGIRENASEPESASTFVLPSIVPSHTLVPVTPSEIAEVQDPQVSPSVTYSLGGSNDPISTIPVAITSQPSLRFGYTERGMNCRLITEIVILVLEKRLNRSIEDPIEYNSAKDLFENLAEEEDEREIDLTFCFVEPDDRPYLSNMRSIGEDFSPKERSQKRLIKAGIGVVTFLDPCVHEFLEQIKFRHTKFQIQDAKSWVEANQELVDSWIPNCAKNP